MLNSTQVCHFIRVTAPPVQTAAWLKAGSYTPHRTETLMFRRHGWEEEEVFLVLAGFAPTLPELERRQA